MTDAGRLDNLASFFAIRQYATAYEIHAEREQVAKDKREREDEHNAVGWLKRALRVETTDPDPPVVFS